MICRALIVKLEDYGKTLDTIFHVVGLVIDNW